MTPLAQDLADVLDLAKRATPGEWRSRNPARPSNFLSCGDWNVTNDEVSATTHVAIHAEGEPIALVMHGSDDYNDEGCMAANADLIAAAVNFLRGPALAALVEDASRERDEGFSDGVILALQVMNAAGDGGGVHYVELLETADAEKVIARAKEEEMMELSGLADYVAADWGRTSD